MTITSIMCNDIYLNWYNHIFTSYGLIGSFTTSSVEGGRGWGRFKEGTEAQVGAPAPVCKKRLEGGVYEECD